MKYNVNEIFFSFQGEGYWAKQPAVFIRLAGCNLKCRFCDTKHDQYTEMDEKEILQKVKEAGGNSRFVVITGGEPTLQDLTALTDILRKNKYYRAIETNGTNKISGRFDWVTVSPKSDPTKLVVKGGDELKIVYEGQDLLQYEVLNRKFKTFYLQPEGRKNETEVIKLILDNAKNNTYKIYWQFSPQLQKIFDVR